MLKGTCRCSNRKRRCARRVWSCVEGLAMISTHVKPGECRHAKQSRLKSRAGRKTSASASHAFVSRIRRLALTPGSGCHSCFCISRSSVWSTQDHCICPWRRSIGRPLERDCGQDRSLRVRTPSRGSDSKLGVRSSCDGVRHAKEDCIRSRRRCVPRTLECNRGQNRRSLIRSPSSGRRCRFGVCSRCSRVRNAEYHNVRTRRWLIWRALESNG